MRFNWTKIWETLAVVGFLLFFLALPISKGLVSIAVGLLFGTAVFRLKQRPIFIFPSYWWLPVVLFFILLISIGYSENYQQAWKQVYRQNMLVLLPFAFWVNVDICRDYFSRAIQIFVAVCSFSAVITILFFFLPTVVNTEITNTLSLLQDYVIHEKEYAFGGYSPFLDRLQFSYLLSTSLLLHIYLYRDLSRRFWLSLSFFLQLMALIILGARGAQIAFLVSSIVGGVIFYFHAYYPSLFHRFGRWKSASFLVSAVFIGGIGLPILAYKTIPSVQMRYDQLRWEIGTLQDGTYGNYAYEHFTSLRRIVSWQSTWQIIQKHPITGVGIGDHKRALQHQYMQGKFDIPVNSHQQFLYYWLVAGIGAALVFLLAYLVFLRQAWQSKIRWKRIILFCFILFYGIVFCLDSPLIYQTGGLAFWSFYLLLIPLMSSENGET